MRRVDCDCTPDAEQILGLTNIIIDDHSPEGIGIGNNRAEGVIQAVSRQNEVLTT